MPVTVLAYMRAKDGDIGAYIRALMPVYGGVARALRPIAMQPVETAKVESAFSKVDWIKSARRNRPSPSALRALSILACNKERAAVPLAEVARRFLTGSLRDTGLGESGSAEEPIAEGGAEEEFGE
jgi:hypothetical protein